MLKKKLMPDPYTPIQEVRYDGVKSSVFIRSTDDDIAKDRWTPKSLKNHV